MKAAVEPGLGRKTTIGVRGNNVKNMHVSIRVDIEWSFGKGQRSHMVPKCAQMAQLGSQMF